MMKIRFCRLLLAVLLRTVVPAMAVNAASVHMFINAKQRKAAEERNRRVPLLPACGSLRSPQSGDIGAADFERHVCASHGNHRFKVLAVTGTCLKQHKRHVLPRF
jgi:hypothetical protein